MGHPAPPAPVQPILGILAASRELLAEARAAIERELAPIDLTSEPSPWTASTYYRDEMGAELWRQFVALAARMAPDDLAEWKHRTNRLEDRWRGPSGRRVNLDPGYLDLLRVVLASTKDAAHRVAVGRGIYAEAALHFAGGRFEPWPYTYPDYAAPDALAFFTRVRARFKADRRAAPAR